MHEKEIERSSGAKIRTVGLREIEPRLKLQIRKVWTTYEKYTLYAEREVKTITIDLVS